MCGGGNPIQNISNALAPVNNFHPLKGIIDQPLIDPILQGDMTISGDVVKGSYLDKKNQNLGLTDVQGTAGFFSKGIAGGLGGAAAGGAAGSFAGEGGGVAAESGSLAGESSAGSLFGEAAADDALIADASNFVTPEAAAGVAGQGDAAAGAMPLAAPTVPNTTDPSADPNTNTNTEPAGGTSFIDATTPTVSLDAATASALGIDAPTFSGADAALGNQVGGFSPGGGESGMVPGTDYSIYTGETPTDMVDPVPDQTLTPNEASPSTGKTPGTMDSVNAALKKVGLNPVTAGMLGISGLQALSKPKTPQASRTLEGTATQGSAQAQSVIQSGGQSSPAWTQQKASIDAGIDQQIKEQSAAILQNAQNSGIGADSQVTVQQINKLKTQLETQRQALYAQAQGQNVQAALQQLGISDQALSGVAAAQYRASQDARSSAANTAQMALMLQSLSRQRGGGSSAGSILPPDDAPGEPVG